MVYLCNCTFEVEAGVCYGLQLTGLWSLGILVYNNINSFTVAIGRLRFFEFFLSVIDVLWQKGFWYISTLRNLLLCARFGVFLAHTRCNKFVDSKKKSISCRLVLLTCILYQQLYQFLS